MRAIQRAYLQGYGGDTSNMVIARGAPRCDALATSRASATIPSDGCSSRCGTTSASTRGASRPTPTAPTGVYFVTHGPHGPRIQLPARRVGSQSYRSGELAARSDPPRHAFFTCSAISQAISASACDAAFARDDDGRTTPACKVSYDTNLRPQAVAAARARAKRYSRRLARCDWCLPSLDDARVLFDTDDADASSMPVTRRRAPVVVLKCGARRRVVSMARGAKRFAGTRRGDASTRPVPATVSTAPIAARIVAGDGAVRRGALRQRRRGARDDRIRRGRCRCRATRTCARAAHARA